MNTRRRYMLIAVVGGVAILALSLRVREHGGPAAEPSPLPASARAPLDLPMPRDYVAEPSVLPDEANAGPRSIVSLAPSITEIVCALGLRDRLIGRTRYCQWPPGIETVPAVGVKDECNYGLIKSLAPEVVLAVSNSGDMLVNLRKLGVRCEAVPHLSLPEVFTAIAEIGRLCGRPKTAAALVDSIKADITRLHASARDAGIPPRRVIVLFGDLPVPPKAVFVAGPGLFLDDLVELAGHRNAARELLKSSQGEIPLEVLRVLDPEVILEFRDPLASQNMADIYVAWSQVGRLQAIEGRRVRSIGGTEWLSAGPRFALELHRFITVLSEIP